MKNTRPLPNLEKDYLVFLWFLTLTTAGFYIYILITNPSTLRNPLNMMISSLLIIIYIILHWFTSKIYLHPWLLVGYIMLQGALSFAIVLLTRVEVMIFALFLALIGEAIGMLGLTRRGMLACGYYLALSLTSFAILKGSGGISWWLLGTIPTVLFVVIYVTLYSRQAEANERARELLAELETANQQLSAYAAQVEDLTIAAERQRMARELHDTLSQGLAGLILQLEAADAHLVQEHPDKARQIIQQTMNRARETLGEARSAIDDLRRGAAPTLEETIRREIENFGNATGISCALEIDLHGELPEPQCDAIARIIPEALNNIQQHAQASMVSIRLLSCSPICRRRTTCRRR